MSRTPNSTSNDGNQSPFPYHAYIGGNLSRSATHSSWMNSGPQYGSYFPHPPPTQPRSLHYAAVAMGSENATTSTSNVNNSIASDKTPNSNLEAPNSVSTSAKIGAKGLTKWREEQSSVLVHEWKERIDEVESSRATEAWRHILIAVNKAGSPKTVKQCKDKIRNLKQAYKEAKGNNNLTGRSPKTSQYYDSFDEVLGTRAVVTMPGVIQSDQVKSAGSDSANSPNTSEAAVNDSEEDSDSGSVESDSSTTSPEAAGSKRKKRVPQKPGRKAKKGRVTAASAMVDLTEKLVEMQSSQMEMMERAQSRSEELLIKMETEQRKFDEESRRRDQEFFLRMAELLKK